MTGQPVYKLSMHLNSDLICVYVYETKLMTILIFDSKRL